MCTLLIISTASCIFVPHLLLKRDVSSLIYFDVPELFALHQYSTHKENQNDPL